MSISRHPTAFLPIPNFQSRIMKSLIVHFCRLITLYLGSCTCIRKYFKKINQIEIHDLKLGIGFIWMLWTSQWASNPLSVSTKTPFTIPQSPFYLPCKKLIFVRLQIFLYAGCNFLHPEELSSHARHFECGYWCSQIWSRILHNWHFLKYFVQIPKNNSN